MATMSSDLISNAELVSTLTSDAVVSVSTGVGQPQKNIKLGDLATVVAEIMGTKMLFPFMSRGIVTSGYNSVDEILNSGFYVITESSGLEKSNGLLVVFSRSGVCYTQIFFSYNGDTESRVKWYNNNWGSWRTL